MILASYNLVMDQGTISVLCIQQLRMDSEWLMEDV